jgi:hypothetical protein
MGRHEDNGDESSERNSQATLTLKGGKHYNVNSASEFTEQDEESCESRWVMSDYSCPTSFAGDDRARTSTQKQVGFDLGSDVESDSSSHDDSESRYSHIERGAYIRKVASGDEQQQAQSSERKQQKQPLRGGITGAHYNRESVQSFFCDSYEEESYGEASESSEHTDSDESQSLSPSFLLQDDRPAPRDFGMMQESAKTLFYDSFAEASEPTAHIQSDPYQSRNPSFLQDDQPPTPTDFRMMEESTQSFFYDSFGEGSESSADQSESFLQDEQLATRDRGDQGDECSDRAVTHFESPTKTPQNAFSAHSGPRLYSQSSDRAIYSQSSDPAATHCSRVIFENDETASTSSRSNISLDAVPIQGRDDEAETLHDSTSGQMVNEGEANGPSILEWDMQETHIKAQIEAAREELRNRHQQEQTAGRDKVPLQELQPEGTATTEQSKQLEHIMAQLEAARQELQAAMEEMQNPSSKNKEPRIETPETELKSAEVPIQSHNGDKCVRTKHERDALGDETSPTDETANNRNSMLQHRVDALEEERRKLYEEVRLLDEASKTSNNEMVAIPSKLELGQLGGGGTPDTDGTLHAITPGAAKSPTPGRLQDDDDDSSTSSTDSSFVLLSPGGGLRAQILRQARDGVDSPGLKSHRAIDPDEADSANMAKIGRSHMLFSPPRGPRDKIRILKQTRDPSDHQRRTNPKALDPEEEVQVAEPLSQIPIQESNYSRQFERSSEQEDALVNEAATIATTNTRKSELYHKVDALEEEKRELSERVRLLEEAKSIWLKSPSNHSVTSRRSAGPMHKGMANGEGFKIKRSKSTLDQPLSSSHKARAKNENQPAKVKERNALKSTIRPIDVRVDTKAKEDTEGDYCQKIPKKDPRWSSQNEPDPSATRSIHTGTSTSTGASIAPQRKASIRPDSDRQIRRAQSTNRMVPSSSPALPFREVAPRERPKRRPRPPENLSQNQIAKNSTGSPASPLELEDAFANHQNFDVVVWEDASICGSAMTESTYDSPIKSQYSSMLGLDSSDDPRWTEERYLGDFEQPVEVVRRTESIGGNQTKKTKLKKESRWDSQHERDPSPVRGVPRSKSKSACASLAPQRKASLRPDSGRQVRRAHSADRIAPSSSSREAALDGGRTKNKRRPPHAQKKVPSKQISKYDTCSGEDASIGANTMTESVSIPPVQRSRYSSKASPNKLSVDSSNDSRWTATRTPEVPQRPMEVIPSTTMSISERSRRSILPNPIRNMFRAKSSDSTSKMPQTKSKAISERSNSNSRQADASVPKGMPGANALDQTPKMPKPLRVNSQSKPVFLERGHSNSNNNSNSNSNSNNRLQPDPIRKMKRAKSSEPMSMAIRKPPLLALDPPDPVRKVSRSKSSDHVMVSSVPRSLAPSSKQDNNNNEAKPSSRKSKVSTKQPKSFPSRSMKEGPPSANQNQKRNRNPAS